MEPTDVEARAAARETIRQLQFYWCGLLCLPLAYLGGCIAIQKWWFGPAGRHGLLPLSQHPNESAVLAAVCGLTALLAEALLVFLRRRFGKWLEEAAQNMAEFLRLLRRRLLILGALCDLVSFFGVIYYVLDGDLRAMLAFGILAYVLYAQIFPQERLAEKVKIPPKRGNGSRPGL